jgi:L-rhamnose mutarotase
VKRVATVIRLRPEKEAEYRRLHADVWPGVLDRLTRSNVRNYSIFLRDGLLFGYYEYFGDDYEADMAAIRADPESQRWWTFTDPCQVPWPDSEGGGRWLDLPEIWHLSDEPGV